MSEQENLPSGWTLAPLSEVTIINPRNPAKVPTDDTPVSFVPMAAVEELSGRMDANTSRPWSDVKKGFTRFQEGDVVLAKITPSMENGKVALAANLVNGVGAGTTEFHVFRSQAGIACRYLLHYLLQETFRRQARARMTGTAGQLRVPKQFLEEECLPLPPTNEQDRIVEAIDYYLTRLDDAVASLKRIQAKLTAYRSSVLKGAVEGRLVPTEAALARAEKRDYEPAEALLARILKERRRRWEEGEQARLKGAGKPPKDDKWKAKYKEPVSPDTGRLPGLPEGWCWASLGQLSYLLRNGESMAPHKDRGVRTLRISAVRPLSVDFEDVRYLPGTPDQYSDSLIEVDDLLFTRYNGTPSLVGVCGMVRVLTEPTVHPDKLIKVRLCSAMHVPFAELAANTGESRRLIESRTRTTAGQAGISGADLKEMPIPLAPATEQARIADEAERLGSIARECARSVKMQVRRATRLRQAVLKWAFEGKLVDQDPTDEPAERLLARIRAERVDTVPGTKRRGRKARKTA